MKATYFWFKHFFRKLNNKVQNSGSSSTENQRNLIFIVFPQPFSLSERLAINNKVFYSLTSFNFFQILIKGAGIKFPRFPLTYASWVFLLLSGSYRKYHSTIQNRREFFITKCFGYFLPIIKQ